MKKVLQMLVVGALISSPAAYSAGIETIDNNINRENNELCIYNNATYSNGSLIVNEGVEYECNVGNNNPIWLVKSE